jgi:chemotaxis protein MotA
MIRTLILWIGIVAFAILAKDIIGEISIAVNIKSGALVLAGTLIGGLLSVPVSAFHSFWQSISVSLKRKASDLDGLILQIVALARLQRVCDIREMSVRIKALENPFLRMGLQQVLDNRDRQLVEENMEREMSLYLSRLQRHLGTINNFTRLAPVFGFVGTIIGLIKVLNHIGDTTQIGHGMAISLLTTFYGLLLANFLFVPIAGKLTAYIHGETLKLNIIIEGVLAICDEITPLEISHRLQAYIETDEESSNLVSTQSPQHWKGWGETLKQSGLPVSR